MSCNHNLGHKSLKSNHSDTIYVSFQFLSHIEAIIFEKVNEEFLSSKRLDFKANTQCGFHIQCRGLNENF